MIHSILPVQFMCLFAQPISKSSLVNLLVWQTGTLHSILHTFLCMVMCSKRRQWSSFRTHDHTNASCFSVVPKLRHLILISLSQLFTWNSAFYLNATRPSDHSHLCPLKCHLIFFSSRPRITSMQHATLHTTSVQSPSHYQ